MEKKRKYIGKKGWERIPFELIKSKVLSSNEKVLLMLLSLNDPCFYSYKYLCEILKCSKRNLQRMIKNLRDRGYLKTYKLGRKRYYEVFWWEYKNTPRNAIEMETIGDTREPLIGDTGEPNRGHQGTINATPGNPIPDSYSDLKPRGDLKLNFPDLFRAMPKKGRSL